MQQAFLPFALATPSFPFRHLASLAGRAPIGGAREVALACFIVARLVAECGAADAELTEEGRATRAAAAKSWLGTLTLPTPVRGPLAKGIESSATGGAAALAREMTAIRAACASYLDVGSRAELDALTEALNGQAEAALPGRASAP